MIGLIKSEILKIRSTQVWFWMLLVAVAFTVVSTIIGLADVHSHQPAGQVDYYGLFTTSQSAQLGLLVLGILGITTEFRHKTMTPTLLATPNRWRLLLAKALSYTFFAAVYALVCVIVDFAMVLSWLKIKHVPIELGHGVPGGVVKAFLALVLIGLFGLGLGAIIRNQAAAMVAGLAYFFAIDGLLSVIPGVRNYYRFTPGGGSTAFTSQSGSPDNLLDSVHVFSPLAGGLVLALWAVGLVVVGGLISLNRDIS